MNDLAVLTPPFLVAAAVIIAIVAFLRHEMGRKRADRADLEQDFSEPETSADNAEDSKSDGNTDTASASARDAQR
jgi:hypothetical protein